MKKSVRSKTTETLDHLFYAKSVALIGASRTPGKWGYFILQNIILGGFKGKIFPVNPKEEEILGLKAYPSIREVPGAVDLAVIVVPPPGVPDIVRECGGKVKVALVITAGFGELGGEEKALEEDLARAAEEAGVRVVGPNCNGVMCSHKSKLYALMPSYFPPESTISMASQSGNVGGIMLRMSMARKCGFGKYVSTGNEADLHMEDYFTYFGEDPDTEVILSYVEGARNGKKLMETVRKITPKKPIVMIKGGRTPAGTVAASSHTGSLAGSDAVFSAMCKQAGVLLVDSMDEQFDVALALRRQPLPKGNRVGILTTGGGLGVLCSDVCHRLGLDVVKLKDNTLKKLVSVLPPWWNPGNPVDLVAGLSRSSIRGCLEALAGADEVDCILMLGLGIGSSRAKILRETPFYEDPLLRDMCEKWIAEETNSVQTVVECIDQFKKPILIVSEVVTFPADERPASLEFLESNGIFPYPNFRRAGLVMKHLVDRRRFLQKSAK